MLYNKPKLTYEVDGATFIVTLEGYRKGDKDKPLRLFPIQYYPNYAIEVRGFSKQPYYYDVYTFLNHFVPIAVRRGHGEFLTYTSKKLLKAILGREYDPEVDEEWLQLESGAFITNFYNNNLS